MVVITLEEGARCAGAIPPGALRRCFEASGTALETVKVRATRKARGRPRRRLHCHACGHTITDEGQKIAVGGSHAHHFTNPAGFTYDIGCFRSAPGCGQVGALTAEYTWFEGYRWQIAVCGECGEHLGWRYSRGSAAEFHGLILARLVGEQ